MKREKDTQASDLTGRLKELEHFTGALVPRPDADADAEVVPIHEAPRTRVPEPRRSRVFLRSGEGHGVFAELTLTAPRPALD
jgi:hypothetical protein